MGLDCMSIEISDKSFVKITVWKYHVIGLEVVAAAAAPATEQATAS